MPRLDRVPELLRNTLLTRPVEVNKTSPFVKPTKPLARSRIAIVTTAGLHLRSDERFRPADPSFRQIPSSSSPADIVQSHTSIGFDRTAVMQDINVVFPIDRLREMVLGGEIGELADTFYSFMGAQQDVSAIANETAPVAARLLREAGVDVVLLTPT